MVFYITISKLCCQHVRIPCLNRGLFSGFILGILSVDTALRLHLKCPSKVLSEILHFVQNRHRVLSETKNEAKEEQPLEVTECVNSLALSFIQSVPVCFFFDFSDYLFN